MLNVPILATLSVSLSLWAGEDRAPLETAHLIWDEDIKKHRDRVSVLELDMPWQFECVCVFQCVHREEEEGGVGGGWVGGLAGGGGEKGSNMGVRVLAVCRPRLWHYRTSAPLQKNQI